MHEKQPARETHEYSKEASKKDLILISRTFSGVKMPHLCRGLSGRTKKGIKRDSKDGSPGGCA